nr:PAS domain S-box protein [Bacteroidota bacterium]
MIINVSSVQDINLPELNTFTSNTFFEENNILHTSRKIRIEEGIYGHLVIGFSVAERDLQISKVWQRGLWANVGMLFFTILFYLYLNRIITKPLIKFVKTIKHIEQTKDYSQVIEAENIDEIGMLVDAFNALNGKVYNQTEELLKSRAQLSAILETIGEGAITINENGKIILVNQECLDIFGYKREELIGKDLTILFPEKYRSRHIESLNNYRKTGISTMMGQRVELEGIRSDKIIFPLEFKIVETKVENKQFFTGSIRDITERKRSEEALKESERRLRKLNATKDKFFSIISHDLRTPFQALLSISDFFANDIDNMTKQEIIDFASDLNQSAESLYELLNNLLDWSRVQTGKMKYEPGEIHLKRSIDKVVHLLTANAHNKRISLTTNISEDLIVYADKNMLHSVVQNLVSNAIKFTNEGGEIKVISDVKDEYTEVVISDNGVGMDKDTL